ncbi:MAG: valine--tRNA ligase [Armatimonadetes bacterium]|nr:valine--tRNA ligase [Armatimonadota bacterium]
MSDNKPQEVSLPTVYDPTSVETKWYKYWMDENYFHAEVDKSRPKYSITIPPPNVTGSLHIGQALCYSIQDVLTRWKRMQGFNTLCLPGTDHAGIATQNKVEQQIADEGLTRHDLGREEFLKRVWAWKTKYGNTILHQFRKMGFSFDWERERFTMDDQYIDAVLESFVRLFNKGYIYRGARVINWCPRCHTAISDIEVEYVEQHSHLWYLRYPLEDGSGHVVVATTRPETMLGDTAVAVNPNDDRYKAMVGKNVKLPLTDRVIPIIADEFVDMEFGTGAVKTTPAHDPNNFEIGLRHNLPQVVVIGPDGTMTQEAGTRYEGQDRFKARQMVLEDLQALGLLEKTEDYSHSVGTCERCHTTIEPLLSEQWFCKMKELAQPAIEVVKQGKVKFFPERYAGIYLEWMENVRDWCISRQLWWGHRIPIYKCEDCGEYMAAKSQAEACSVCGSANMMQDPDVLDTWFSSALWPFATMGWPEQTPEMEYFYPTDVLVTARDIIYLWVARMIFSSLEYLDTIPFKDVYIYATVMNEEGKRMSKSLGTGVNPLLLIEQFGADALRFDLIQQAGKNQDIRFSDKRVEIIRNFCNKIWNASRFVIMNLEGYSPASNMGEASLSSILSEPSHSSILSSVEGCGRLEDRWILSRLNRTIEAVNASFTTYDMDDAARALYEFIWNDYCDWYIELAKPRLRGDAEEREQVQAILHYVLDTTLRLMHPIMPFITEEIWQALPHEGDSIMMAKFPELDKSMLDQAVEDEMALLMDGTRIQRDLKASQNIPLRQNMEVSLLAYDSGIVSDEEKAFLESTANTTISFIDCAPSDPENYVANTALKLGTFYMPRPKLDEAQRQAELTRVNAELASIEKELARSSGKLANESFVSKAPPEIIEKEKRIVAELSEKKQHLDDRKAALTG